jgi:hypothetical protein
MGIVAKNSGLFLERHRGNLSVWGTNENLSNFLILNRKKCGGRGVFYFGIGYFGIGYFGIGYFGIGYFGIGYFGIGYFGIGCFSYKYLLSYPDEEKTIQCCEYIG